MVPNAEPAVSDIWFVDPLKIEVRGRGKATEAAILEMAISLHVHGQRRAVECRRNGDVLVLEHGYVRTMAARLIRTGFKYLDPETDAEVKVKDRAFKLKVVITS